MAACLPLCAGTYGDDACVDDGGLGEDLLSRRLLNE